MSRQAGNISTIFLAFFLLFF